MRTAVRRLLLVGALVFSLSACGDGPILCVNPIGPGAVCVP